MNCFKYENRSAYIRFISLPVCVEFLVNYEEKAFLTWSFNIKTGRKLKRNHFGHKNASGQSVNKNFLFRKSD